MTKQKTITRRWIGTGTKGKVASYTEQRYLAKHSISFYQMVHQKADWMYFKQQLKRDISTVKDEIDQQPSFPTAADLNNLIAAVNQTQTIRINYVRENVLFKSDYPKYLQRLSEKCCNDLIDKCCHGALLSLSGKCPIGVRSPSEDLARLRKCLAAWKKLFFGKSKTKKVESDDDEPNQDDNSNQANSTNQPAKSTNKDSNQSNVITTLSAVVSIDFEWQASPEKAKTNNIGEIQSHVTSRRSFGDVLSCQYAIFLPDYPKLNISGIIFNDSPLGFNFKQLITKFTDIIQHEFHALNDQHRPIVLKLQHLKMLITGYFLGVDFSCSTGWNKLPIHLIVQGKHRIFSVLPYPIYLRRRKGKDIKVSLTVRDTASIAPMGGLKKLGEIVNQPKIDTTKQDAIDFATHRIGLADYCRYLHDGGFYKNNMELLKQRHFKLYCAYALNDSVVALKYLKLFVKTFHLSWENFDRLPPTTTNNAIREVAQKLDSFCANQRIYDSTIPFKDIKLDPVACVRNYYRDLYIASTSSYFGGFNVSFGSVVTFGNVVDTDLASAYVLASALMAKPNYSRPRSINNLDHLYYSLTSLDKYSGISFEELYDKLKTGKGFPFVSGTALVDVDYPSDYQGIVVTPQRSPKSGNPIFVRHLKHKYLTLIDAIDAYEHGAAVKLYSAEIPAQNWNTYNAWASVQLHFLKLRNQAKANRAKYAEGSDEYKKYDALQLLYKLAGNTIYGGSAQSVLPKSTRNYLTNRTEKIHISKVTDPVIAGTYTAITRYLAHILYDSVREVYKSQVLPLNVTTDGYTFVIPKDKKFDFDAVNAAFNHHLPTFYQQRLHANGFEAGFARKGDTSDTATEVYNLRTRLNGTPNLNSLDAMGGITGLTPKTLWPIIKSGQVVLKNKSKRFSNLTEMKYGTKRSNHQAGVMLEWEQQVDIPLQYDCAYRPDKWLPKQWPGYGFIATPFNTVEEHDIWKKHSKLLTDRWNITKEPQYFKCYLDTMEHFSFARTEKTLDAPSYHDRVCYVINRLHGKKVPTNRQFKNTLYRTKRAIKNGQKLPICPMAIYDNQKEY